MIVCRSCDRLCCSIPFDYVTLCCLTSLIAALQLSLYLGQTRRDQRRELGDTKGAAVARERSLHRCDR